jgi:hypothetical protein
MPLRTRAAGAAAIGFGVPQSGFDLAFCPQDGLGQRLVVADRRSQRNIPKDSVRFPDRR